MAVSADRTADLGTDRRHQRSLTVGGVDRGRENLVLPGRLRPTLMEG